jgi:pimeloyl-ACP methyl ester carboxylesterase
MRRLILTALAAGALVTSAAAGVDARGTDAAVVSVYPVSQPRGVMATSGGWAYCLQLRALAKRFGYTLVCGRYYRDGYTGPGLRSKRLLDWGNPEYLRGLADAIARVHASVGGELVLAGVSYSGFGVAALASHHPELRPDRLIVIDSYLDLPARRAAAGPGGTGSEIDAATGGSAATLRSQSVSVPGLAELLRGGAELTIVWSISEDEEREFNGATCNRGASAGVLAEVADALGRPVVAWVTRSRHGHDLWDSGRRIVAGKPPGRRVTFEPGAGVPPGSTCG